MIAAPVLADIHVAFERRFGSRPRVFRAPGRTNLIGEHTDYNDGFVLPVAIDRQTTAAIAPAKIAYPGKPALRIHSEEFAETLEFDLRDASPSPRGHWSDYVRGVSLMLEKSGYGIGAADLLIRSNVPMGAGVSSSASLEVAAAMAMDSLGGREIPRLDLARLCQRAENEFVGARCGIMDQFVACFGRAGHAVFLDCRSLEYALVALPPGLKLVLCNTMVKHEIAAGEYNARRRECESAVKLLASVIPGVRALRDVTPTQVDRNRKLLPGMLFRRAKHVTTENARVLEARVALETGNLSELSRLMKQSHESLRDDYEVSCRELDVMAELAWKFDGCLGARMTGGGFGGCTINLVNASKTKEFGEHMKAGYEAAIGRSPEIYYCESASGAEEVV
ncbi:MAG TPA: galactokinase [Candidatus Acidoferrales bacterium]|nr:galactokinase [Candidatus Acidoferrales bacterium]